MLGFVLATAVLVALDLAVTYKRINQFGAGVELNPVARFVAEKYSDHAAIIFLGAFNVSLVAAMVIFDLPRCLNVFFGVKLGLAALQLKSLYLDHNDLRPR